MQKFFKYLSFLKKKLNTTNKVLFFMSFVTLSLIGFFLGLIVDIYLPWNFIFNTVRCLVVLYVSTVLFSFAFSIVTEIKQRYNKRFKYEWLKDLSFKQRTNLSIIIAGICIILFVLTIKVNSVYYTFVAGILFSIFIWLVYFMRPTADEIEAMYAGEEDMRDIEYKKNRKKKV
jgi:hypothetical protein